MKDNPLIDIMCDKQDNNYVLNNFGKKVLIVFAFSGVIQFISYVNYYFGFRF